ncbi:MAG TPA: hypothetical protein VMT30_07175 [Candidatus Saccharimonadia bacterium]|nr:hypothetical protein [Candidatus Saccharimonadia bacterium]
MEDPLALQPRHLAPYAAGGEISISHGTDEAISMCQGTIVDITIDGSTLTVTFGQLAVPDVTPPLPHTRWTLIEPRKVSLEVTPTIGSAGPSGLFLWAGSGSWVRFYLPGLPSIGGRLDWSKVRQPMSLDLAVRYVFGVVGANVAAGRDPNPAAADLSPAMLAAVFGRAWDGEGSRRLAWHEAFARAVTLPDAPGVAHDGDSAAFTLAFRLDARDERSLYADVLDPGGRPVRGLLITPGSPYAAYVPVRG